MYSLGMDLGTSTVKIVLMQNGTVAKYCLPCITAGRFCACGRACRNLLLAGTRHLLFA